MERVLIIQGAGMDQRGKVDVDVFGPETLEEIDARIRADARALEIEVDIVQCNDEADLVARLQAAGSQPYAALLINPAGFTTTSGPLPDAVGSLPFPAYEVHASNPSSRGVRSALLPACRGGVCGFGYDGYRMALQALKRNSGGG